MPTIKHTQKNDINGFTVRIEINPIVTVVKYCIGESKIAEIAIKKHSTGEIAFDVFSPGLIDIEYAKSFNAALSDAIRVAEDFENGKESPRITKAKRHGEYE